MGRCRGHQVVGDDGMSLGQALIIEPFHGRDFVDEQMPALAPVREMRPVDQVIGGHGQDQHFAVRIGLVVDVVDDRPHH